MFEFDLAPAVPYAKAFGCGALALGAWVPYLRYASPRLWRLYFPI